MTGILDVLNSYLAQAYQLLQILILGPNNWVFFSVLGSAAIGGMLLRRGFKREIKIERGAPGVPTAKEYLESKGKDWTPDDYEAQPQGGGEADQEKAIQTSPPPTDPELTRRLDAIEEVLMKLSAKGDKTAIEPLLRLSERKIPVEISGTIEGEFDIPIAALRNVRIGVKQVKEEKVVMPSLPTETPPAEGE